jgi:PAS domain S-box-containing protein
MTPLRILLAYAAFGVVWVLVAERALALLGPSDAARHGLLTVRAVLYVGGTAVLLHLLLRGQHGARRVRHQAQRAVLESMPDAVLVVDRGSRVVDANRAAVALIGARGRDDLIVPLRSLLQRVDLRRADGRRLDLVRAAARRAVAPQRVTGYEALVRRFDGSELFVSISFSPVAPRPDDPARLLVAVIRDISAVKRFEEMREDFLATAAHEFKTPLAVVKAYAQLMHKRGQGDAAALEVIARQIDRMTRIVQQLLDVSRFRVGGAELSQERFDLPGLVAEVAGELRPDVDGPRIVVAPAPPTPVLADRERIAQVVASLLENAIRFSPRGGDVEAEVTRRAAEAVVSVRDHGVGIPPERQKRIFERFYRAHAGTDQDYGGRGIGLDVSREIVARHGGRIWFESAPGLGSTFSFSLPLAPEEVA